MIDLAPDDACRVDGILAALVPDCEVWIFGSRVQGKATSYSDLDLALAADEPLDWRRMESLKDAFAESDLTFIVDVVDLNGCSPAFADLIRRTGCRWRSPGAWEPRLAG